MTHTLDLPGLREDMARDFLAAIGLLRLLDLKWPSLKPKLSWETDQGFPRIDLNSELPHDWCQQLVADIQSLEKAPESPLFHGEIIKAAYQVFRTAILKVVDFKKTDHPLAALPELMFAAYGEQIAAEKTRDIEPSMLSFANNQSGKLLLRDVRELIRAWNPDDMICALRGDGTPTPGKSFRWAPHEYRSAAYCAQDPTSKVAGNALMDFPAFNILAFFGLSCVSTTDTTADCSTASFLRTDNGWAFTWPIWETPIDATLITALLSVSDEQKRGMKDVSRIWRSLRIVTPNKSVYFASATLA
jgi:hypothetical protein